MTLIVIGIIVVAIAFIGAIINIVVAVKRDDKFENVFARHAAFGVALIVGLVLIAFGILKALS